MVLIYLPEIYPDIFLFSITYVFTYRYPLNIHATRVVDYSSLPMAGMVWRARWGKVMRTINDTRANRVSLTTLLGTQTTRKNEPISKQPQSNNNTSNIIEKTRKFPNQPRFVLASHKRINIPINILANTPLRTTAILRTSNHTQRYNHTDHTDNHTDKQPDKVSDTDAADIQSIFAYGTLRDDDDVSNQPWTKPFIESAVSCQDAWLGGYKLYMTPGGYPHAVKCSADDSATPLKGRLITFPVSIIQSKVSMADSIEGVSEPSKESIYGYSRIPVKVMLTDAKLHPAAQTRQTWAYVKTKADDGAFEIAEGDYVHHMREASTHSSAVSPGSKSGSGSSTI